MLDESTVTGPHASNEQFRIGHLIQFAVREDVRISDRVRVESILAGGTQIGEGLPDRKQFKRKFWIVPDRRDVVPIVGQILQAFPVRRELQPMRQLFFSASVASAICFTRKFDCCEAKS